MIAKPALESRQIDMSHHSTLPFSDLVHPTFAFLKEHGFSSVWASSMKVRYESYKVYIEVSYGEREGEVSISFGRMNGNEEFSFTLFLRLTDPAFEKALGERLANNADELRNCVRKLGDALRTRGQPIIAGEDWLFDRMKDVRWWDFDPDALKDS